MFFCGFLLSIKDNKLAANDVYFVNYSPRTRIWANHTSLQKLERILERSGMDSILHVLDTLLGKYLILKTFFAEAIFECLETWNVNL